MNRRFVGLLQILVAGFDLLMINQVIFLGYLYFQSHISSDQITYYFSFWLFNNTSWLFLCFIFGLYNGPGILHFETFLKKSARVYFLWMVSIMVYLFFFRQYELSRLFVIGVLAGCGFLIVLNRAIYFALRHFLESRDYLLKKVIILGYNEVAKKLASYLEVQMNTRVVGYCANSEQVYELTNYPVVNNVNNVLLAAKEMGVNEIYSTISPELDNEIYSLMQQADQQCIRFRLAPDLSLFIKQPVHINYLNDLPVLTVRSEPLDDVSNQLGKRCFDIVVSSLVILFVLSWLIPFIGLLIWLETKAAIFFVQPRSGKNNKVFNCIKFRSMKPNKEANVMQAERNDKRFTQIGKFLRRSNLDEFPQFINVLKGEMSLVGPRPHMLRHTEDYSKMLRQYMVRQFLKPGITGWAQVNGFRGEIKDDDQLRGRVEHDIWYMENWSLWLDIKIMFLTFYKTAKGDKNAF